MVVAVFIAGDDDQVVPFGEDVAENCECGVADLHVDPGLDAVGRVAPAFEPFRHVMSVHAFDRGVDFGAVKEPMESVSVRARLRAG